MSSESVVQRSTPRSPQLLKNLFQGRSSLIKGPGPSEPEPVVVQSPLTRPQVTGQAAKNWMFTLKRSIQTRQRVAGQKSRIQPEEQYVMQTEGTLDTGPIRGWSKGQVFTGMQVLGFYDQIQQKNKLSTAGYLKGTSQLITQVKGLPSGSLFYPEDQGFVVATPAAQDVLGFYKSKGYDPLGGDIGFYKSFQEGQKPVQPYDVLKQTRGESTAKLLLGTYAASPLGGYGIPFLFAGVGEALGFKGSITQTREQYATSVLQFKQSKGEKTEDYLYRTAISPDVIFGIYVPVITFGVGSAIGYFAEPIAESVAARYVSYLGTKKVLSIAGKSLTVGTAVKVGVTVGIGGYTGFQIYQQPEQTPMILGRLTAVLGTSYVAGVSGVSFGRSLSYKPGMNFSGTAYESYVSDVSRRPAVLESQYRSYEFGSPSTHYQTTITPFYERIPYVPITPTKLHFTERIFSPTDGEAYQSFILQRPTVSKRTMSYSIPHQTGEEGTFFSYGKQMTKQGYVKDISEFSYSKLYASSGDIDIYKTWNFGKNGYHGTSVNKLVFGDTSIPTKTGLMTIKSPVDISFISSRQQSVFYDVYGLGKEYRRVFDVTTDSFSGGSMGLDTTGVKGFQGATDFRLPGGSSDLFAKTRGYQGAFPKMISRKGIALSDIESLEYGIQSSARWTGAIPRATVLSKVTTKPLSSLLSFNVLGTQSKNILSVQRQPSLNLSKHLNVQSSAQYSLSLSVQSSLQDVLSLQVQRIGQINIHRPTPTPVFDIQDVLSVPSAIPPTVSTIIPAVTVPFIPFLPISGFSSWPGGGYGGRRRKKKGARHRTHPVELYDILSVSTEGIL